MTNDHGFIFVTGANGRIGQAVMERFGRRVEVVGTDRHSESPPPPGCVFLPVDFRTDESVREGLEVVRSHHGAHIISVIHLAAYYSFSEERSPMYDEVTVRGTERLLRGLHDVGFTVEQFIFSSTMLVHLPTNPGELITEDSPMEATWAYPESKIKTEAVIQAERGEFPAVFLRIAGVYDDGCHSIPLANEMQRIYERQFTSRFYSGEIAHGQSYVHMDDVVDAIELAVERRKELSPVTPLLIGEPVTLSYDELQHSFARLIHGEDWETQEVPGPLAKAGAWLQNLIPGKKPFIKPWMIDRANDHYELDITRARTLIGWEPKHPLRETLPKMVAALKADPLGWYKENGLDPPRRLRRSAPNAGDPPSGQGSGGGGGTDPPADENRAAGEHAGHRSASGTADPSHEEHQRHSLDARPTPPPGQAQAGHEGHGPINSGLAPATRGHEGHQMATASQAMPNASAHEGHGAMAAMPGHQMAPAPALAETGEHGELVMEPEQGTLWAHFFAIMILGIWLITSPFALDYGDDGMLWSDILSGAALIVLATVTIARRSAWSSWAIALVGVWLLFAPLVFWAPRAGAYANDTLVGTLVIVFAILMPGMPGLMRMFPGPDRPPGWSYNPSSWPQRAPIIALAFIGFILSRQMAAYQLGYTDSVWEPFFDPGTRAVLESDVSMAFPISDAGFGGVAYMIEGLMGFMGDGQRWRSMPWMVTFFGILVVPLGLVSITLIILQPVAVGEWCTPCLLAALAMLVMIALTLDEVVAMGLFLVLARREGQSLWRVFWLGGTLTEAATESRGHPDVISSKAMVWGVALPWTLLVSTALGLWLMAAPSVLDSTGNAAHSDHLVGALVVSVAIMALADVGRPLRFINVLFGAWFIVAPWLLDGATTGAALSDVLVGVALIALSLPRGPVGERYGAWEPYVR